MVGKGVCVNGTLDATSYNSPVPFVGIYIVVATLVCFFCMTFDLVYGLFIGRKPFLPCKLFHLNAFTLTVLTVATKIPNDLVTQMPRVEDQLSKLMGTAFLCTALGFYMPSLGTLDSSERYGNLAALSVTIITVVVDVGIQIHTGVIFDFTTEHIIILVCISVMLLYMWSSAIGLRAQINDAVPAARVSMSSHGCMVEDLNGLRELVQTVHKHNCKANPQTLMCSNPNHHIFGLLCALSLVLVLKSMFESFVLRSMKTCGNGVSDYKWSILFVIVAQFLAIVVGTFSVIYRWLSYLLHVDPDSLSAGAPLLELEYLKVNILPLTFLNKNLSHVLVVAKDFLMDVLMLAQLLLYICSRFVFALPISVVRAFFDCMINGDEQRFDSWMDEMVNKEMTRYSSIYTRDRPSKLIQLISNCPVSKSECDDFIGKLEAAGKEVLERIGQDCGYEYRVSCVSILVLSGVLVELMPTSRKESLMQILDESFEIIYFVDRKTHTPNRNEVKRWMSTKDVWAHWENPNHWFRKIFSLVFKKKYDEDFKSEQAHDAFGVLRDAHDALQTDFEEYDDVVGALNDDDSMDRRHGAIVLIELLIICKFLGEQWESVEDPFNFLEMCFIKMLCFILSDLPLAILKQIEGDDPTEMDEGRVRDAVKFLCKLELLQNNKAGWSWPNKSAPNTQANDVHCDGTSDNAADVLLDANHAADVDDGDTIQEIGSAEIV